MKKVLFVCLGNICRSPMAEAIFNQLVKKKDLSTYFSCDSAGTSSYHIGERPDTRALLQLKSKGISTSHHARQFTKEDSLHFSYIFAMDRDNYENIKNIVGSHPNGLSLIRAYDPEGRDKDVPDPYYGGQDGFEDVYNMLLRSLENFLQQTTK